MPLVIRSSFHGLRMLRATLLITAVVVCVNPAYCDSKSVARQEVPVELRASDPEVGNLIESATDKLESDDLEGAFKLRQQAWDLCNSKHLTSDLPVAGLELSALSISKGDIGTARELLNKSLEAAAERSNLALQAQILVSLASIREISGDRRGALDTDTRALQKAQAGKSLYVQARAFGEIGRLWLASGALKDGKAALNAALDIDKANHYSLEALHQVYSVYSLLIESDQNLPIAIKTLEEALKLANATGNRFAAFAATGVLGAAYIAKGDVNRGLELLKADSSNKSLILEFSRLETLAFAYQAGHLPEKSVETWTRLLDRAKTVGNQYFIGEAAQKLGDASRDKGQAEIALGYYETAADSLRRVGNKTGLLQVLTSEIPLLQTTKHDDKASQIYADTLRLLQEEQGTASSDLQFAVYLQWSLYHKQRQEWQKEIDDLERAESLAPKASPDHPRDPSVAKTMLAMWIDHALAAANLNLPYISILAQEQAFQCALQLNDEKAQRIVMAATLEVEQKLGQYNNLRTVCDSGQLQNCLESALALNTLELLNEEWRNNWKSEQGLAVSKIASIIPQIGTSPEGVKYLVHLLSFVSPIAVHVRIPIDMALAKNLLFSSNDPSSAKHVLEDAESILSGPQISINTVGEDALKITLMNVHCWHSLALAQTGESDAAERTLSICLQEAKQIGTADARRFAEAASSSVRLLTNNPSAAAEGVKYWIDTLGDSPELRRGYAYSLAAGSDFEGAIREMNLAANMFEKAKRYSDLVQAYRALASYHAAKGHPDYERSISYLENAISILPTVRDARAEADVEIELGADYGQLGKLDEARRWFVTAEQVAEKADYWEIAARCLWGLAEMSQKTQKDDAASLYARAGAFFSKAKLPDQEAIVLTHEADILRGKGDNEQSLRNLLHARDLVEQTTNYAAGAFVYSSLGYAYESTGEFLNSVLAFTAARDKAKAAKNTSLEAYDELAISRGLQMIGDWEAALQHAEAALKEFKGLGDEKGEVFAYSALMGVYTERSSELKDFEKASQIYREASSLKTFQAESLTPKLQLLEMYVQTKQYNELIEKATELLNECRELKDNVCIAHLHISLAEAHLGRTEYQAARDELNLSKPLIDQAHDYYSSGRFLYAKARLERGMGDLQAAIRDYSDVTRMINELQDTSNLRESSSISENYNFIFDEFVGTLYQASAAHTSSGPEYADLALRTVESNKAISFDNLWGSRFSDAVRRKLPTDVREREMEIQLTKSRLSTELRNVLAAGSHPNRPAEQIRSELAESERQLRSFIETLREKYPVYAMVRYPLPLQVKDVAVHDGELIVECRVTEDASYVWFLVKGKNGHASVSKFYSVPKGREWIRAQVRRVKQGISESQVGGFEPKSVQELTNTVFSGENYSLLKQAKSIVYIPDDALSLVPLEMLSPDAPSGVYPLAAIPTTYYPSAQAMMMSRSAKSVEAQWDEEIFGIGDPITSQADPRWETARETSSGNSKAVPAADSEVASKLRSAGVSFERLPGTAAEVQGIARLFEHNGGKADIRIGLEANRKKFLDTDLRSFRFLHFATHGLLPVDSGLREPALLFSFSGNAEDMFLQLSQVLDLQLRSEMVVLSACNTGSGKLSKTEGVYNLGRGFLAAGSSSVVISMWEVADNSTAVFMQELYRSILKGDPKNIALMHARMALIHQGYDQPFFWAPFILMGE